MRDRRREDVSHERVSFWYLFEQCNVESNIVSKFCDSTPRTVSRDQKWGKATCKYVFRIGISDSQCHSSVGRLGPYGLQVSVSSLYGSSSPGLHVTILMGGSSAISAGVPV